MYRSIHHLSCLQKCIPIHPSPSAARPLSTISRSIIVPKPALSSSFSISTSSSLIIHSSSNTIACSKTPNKTCLLLSTPGRRSIMTSIAPQVVPFSISRAQAAASLKAHLSKQYLAPRSLRNADFEKELKRIYVPFWSFDCQLISRYTGDVGVDANSAVYDSNLKRYTQTIKTHWNRIAGSHVATQSAAPESMICAYSLQELARHSEVIKTIPTKAMDLNGSDFRIEGDATFRPINLASELAWETVSTRIRANQNNLMRADLLKKHASDKVRLANVDVDFQTVKCVPLYLPCFSYTYQFKHPIFGARDFQFVVSGTTGAVSSDMLYSFPLIFGASFASLSSLSALFLAMRGPKIDIMTFPDPPYHAPFMSTMPWEAAAAVSLVTALTLWSLPLVKSSLADRAHELKVARAAWADPFQFSQQKGGAMDPNSYSGQAMSGAGWEFTVDPEEGDEDYEDSKQEPSFTSSTAGRNLHEDEDGNVKQQEPLGARSAREKADASKRLKRTRGPSFYFSQSAKQRQQWENNFAGRAGHQEWQQFEAQYGFHHQQQQQQHHHHQQQRSSARGKGKDLYRVLGVTRTATTEEIKVAFRKQALEWHPDKHAEDKKEAAGIKFKELTEAYRVLRSKELRAEYDVSR